MATLEKKTAAKTLDDKRGGRKVTCASAEQCYKALDKYGID